MPEVADTLRSGSSSEKAHGKVNGTDRMTLVPTFWNGEQVTQTLDAVPAKGQTMPEKNRFPAVLVPATTHTLKAEGFDASEDGTGRGVPLVPVAGTDCWNGVVTGDVSSAVTAGGMTDAYNPTVMVPAQDPAHPLGACPGAYRSYGEGQFNYLSNAMQVRRLLPVECERLQGFPDDHTLIPWRKKPASECPDGPRYKAIGNSMAVPVMNWIGRRINLFMEGTL